MDNGTQRDAVQAFLTQTDRLTAVIATVSADGTPSAAVVYYYVDRDCNFFFLTATNTHKHANLLANPKAAITIGFGPAQTTLQGSGVAVLLEKRSDDENLALVHIKKRLIEHDNEAWPIFQLDAFDDEAIAVFKFIPESLQLLNLEHDNGLIVTTKDIEQII